MNFTGTSKAQVKSRFANQEHKNCQGIRQVYIFLLFLFNMEKTFQLVLESRTIRINKWHPY